MKNQTEYYQDLWQDEIDSVIGEDYHHYEIKHREKPKMKLLEIYLDRIPEKESILEIGCGSGRILSQFKNQFGVAQGYGIDISEKAVSFARDHHKDCEFSVLNIDQNDLSYKDSEIDIVLLCDIVEHVTDVNHLLREAVRVGKHVVIKVPLEKTLMEYIMTLCGRDTSINRRHVLGHIHSFSQGFFIRYFRDLAKEMPIQVEMNNASYFTHTAYWILNTLAKLLKSTWLYRFVFTTDLGIYISKVAR
jgi:ubiquinone/menaquinone biosynthesis C-methylase UbiE